MTFRRASMMLAAALVTAFFLGSTAHAQGMKINPKGISGSAGAGFVTWTTLEPGSANFRFDQGQFVAVAGERGFGVLNLYLNLSLAYMKGTGQVNYRYQTLTTETYTANDVNFSMELFQAGLGLKLKLIDGYWFRPYIEGGGTGGWFKIAYDNLANKVTSSPVAGMTNYKKEDSLLDFGRYAEGGIEISFSDQFGIRPAARFVDSETKKLLTLDNKALRYQAAIYYLALLVSF